jgi:hypothetical protein
MDASTTDTQTSVAGLDFIPTEFRTRADQLHSMALAISTGSAVSTRNPVCIPARSAVLVTEVSPEVSLPAGSQVLVEDSMPAVSTVAEVSTAVEVTATFQ